MFPTEDLDEPGTRKSQRHISDIQMKDMVTWNIDLKQMGVGGDTSWGAYPHQQSYPCRKNVLQVQTLSCKREGNFRKRNLYRTPIIFTLLMTKPVRERSHTGFFSYVEAHACKIIDLNLAVHRAADVDNLAADIR